jgi:hypothetical protein
MTAPPFPPAATPISPGWQHSYRRSHRTRRCA